MVQALGLADIIAAVFLASVAFGIQIPAVFLVVVSSILLMKASIYIADIGSVTDVIIAILLISNFFIILPWWILVPGALVIGNKGIMSLFATSS